MAVDQSAPVRGFRHHDPHGAHRATRAAGEIRTIASAIARNAESRPDAPAFVDAVPQTITFSRLAEAVASFARLLAEAGLRRDDRVGLVVPPGLAGGLLVVSLACNATLVPINPSLKPDEIGELARLTRLKAAVIPRWIGADARAILLEQKLAVFDAVRMPDGGVGLELVTPVAGEPAEIAPASAGDVAVLLRSSGTTGAPKLIPVTHGNLVAMAEKFGSSLWFHMSADDRAACMLPLYYAAGLKTTLFVPLILGASVAFPPDGKAFDLASWAELLDPTYLSVAPGPLNGVIDRLRLSEQAFRVASLRFVMCASAYLPEQLRLAAEKILRVPVLEFYGLSEAGVMSANPVPPGLVKPGTVGVPAPGELLVVDGTRRPVPAGAVGHIMISGPTVMPGYVSTDHSSASEMKEGWLLTGDLGRIDRDGYLTIVGRLSEVINKGGEKVFPYEIEKALLEHPAVLEAAAFGLPHRRLGESVAAAAVLKNGSDVTGLELKEFLALRLAAFKLPRQVHIVESLPRGNTGKVVRRTLTETFAAQPRGPIEQPDCLMELEVRDIWARLLGTQEVGLDVDFFELGGDSLLATEMLLEVERLAGRPYPPAELANLTVRHIAAVLKSALPARGRLVTQSTAGDRIPVFFCHGDFLTRGIYAHKLFALVPGGHPVFLLDCCADGPVASSIEDIARRYLHDVLPLARGTPVVVGGYCNGGLAAWHLTHLLRAEGVDVAQLLLLETISLNARGGMRGMARFWGAVANLVPAHAGDGVRRWAMKSAWLWRRRLAHFTYTAATRKLLSALSWEPPAELRPEAANAARGFLELMSTYIPPALDVKVTCFIAEGGRHFDTDPAPWRRLVGEVAEVGVPGTHTSAVVSGRGELAQAMGTAMRYAAAGSAPKEPATARHSSANANAGTPLCSPDV